MTLFACTTPLSKKNILVIGDDHAAAIDGWVYHFQLLRKGGPMVNAAVKGATTGFPNVRQQELNTLDQLTPYLRRGYAEMGAIDEIIIQLGTNDCQEKFRASDVERSKAFRDLLANIRSFFSERGQPEPRIVLVSPPIMANEVARSEFEGGASCVSDIAKDMDQLAQKEELCYLDISQSQQLLEYLKPDGVTFQAEGYKLMAKMLKTACY